jgi:hypothetical protein
MKMRRVLGLLALTCLSLLLSSQAGVSFASVAAYGPTPVPTPGATPTPTTPAPGGGGGGATTNTPPTTTGGGGGGGGGATTETPAPSVTNGRALPGKATVVVVGGPLTLTWSGFAPFEEISNIAHSISVVLPTIRANATGGAVETITLPTSLLPGPHEVVATGLTSGRVATFHFNIIGSTTGGGWSTLDVLGAVAAGVLCIGGIFLLFYRRRRDEQESDDSQPPPAEVLL